MAVVGKGRHAGSKHLSGVVAGVVDKVRWACGGFSAGKLIVIAGHLC